MADRPSARDEDRLPWLEPFGEGEQKRVRKPVSRTALVGLLVAFFGVGLAVAFSLGYRVARPTADTPAVTPVEQPPRTASVTTPLPPPTPELRTEPVPPPLVTEAPIAAAPIAVAPKPDVKKARTKAKAKKRYTKRKPILRPFNLVKRPPLVAVPPPPRVRTPAPPLVWRGPTPRGRVIQLGAYSTPRQADAAYRSIVFRHPYLATKPKVIAPTRPIGGWRYYRLRLGTETQAQSAVICQQLQAKGQSCIVIY